MAAVCGGLPCVVFSGIGNGFNPWKNRVAGRRNAANRLDAELARQNWINASDA